MLCKLVLICIKKKFICYIYFIILIVLLFLIFIIFLFSLVLVVVILVCDVFVIENGVIKILIGGYIYDVLKIVDIIGVSFVRGGIGGGIVFIIIGIGFG